MTHLTLTIPEGRMAERFTGAWDTFFIWGIQLIIDDQRETNERYANGLKRPN
jgi:hypothetical protein